MHYLKIIIVSLLYLYWTQARAQYHSDSMVSETDIKFHIKHQDSLRNSIIKNKSRLDIANSVLQELYVRNAIELRKDSIFFQLNFDIHSAACLAPDGYTHKLNFAIPDKIPMQFPTNISVVQTLDSFDVHKKTELWFQLVSQTDTCIVYHSETNKLTLVIYKNCIGAQYFNFMSLVEMEKEGILKIIEKSATNENRIPFRSSIFNSNYAPLYTK